MDQIHGLGRVYEPYFQSMWRPLFLNIFTIPDSNDHMMRSLAATFFISFSN